MKKILKLKKNESLDVMTDSDLKQYIMKNYGKTVICNSDIIYFINRFGNYRIVKTKGQLIDTLIKIKKYEKIFNTIT